MERRHFVLTLGALLAELTFSPAIHASTPRRVLLVSAGNCGMKLLSATSQRFLAEGNIRFRTCVINWADVPKNKFDIAIRLDETATSSGLSHRAAQKHFNAAEFVDRINIKNFDVAIVFAGLRGGTGGGLAPILAERLIALGIEAHILAVFPFSFEYRETSRKTSIVKFVLKHLQNTMPEDRLHIVSMDKISESLNDEVSLEELFKSIDHIVAEKSLDIVLNTQSISSGQYMYDLQVSDSLERCPVSIIGRG